MAQSFPRPALRPLLPDDAQALASIMQDSIMELTGEDYSEAQQEAWAENALAEGFAARLAGALTLVATLEGSPAGFITLQENKHIDLFYVHPAAAGRGVGAVLYDAIEKLAAARGSASLTVDASDTARPFFEQRGFVAQRRNTVSLGDEWLANTTMEKRFAPDEDRKLSS
jgi:putative acetyltransferase